MTTIQINMDRWDGSLGPRFNDGKIHVVVEHQVFMGGVIIGTGICDEWGRVPEVIRGILDVWIKDHGRPAT